MASSSGRNARLVGRPGDWAAVAVAGLGVLFFLLPVVGLATRVPWLGIGTALANPLVLDALRLSVVTSVLAVVVSIVVGAPLAWVLARRELPVRRFLRAAVTLPMVLPPVIAGVGLLAAFGRRGLLGPALEAAGIQLPFTTAAAVLAQTFVAAPFLVLQLEAGLRSLDPRYGAVAEALGASRLYAFRRVTIPLLAPSILAGVSVAWARALGEFGATIMFAGNLEGVTQTMPLAVYIAMESDPEAAYLLSFILLSLAFAVLYLLRGRIAASVAGGTE